MTQPPTPPGRVPALLANGQPMTSELQRALAKLQATRASLRRELIPAQGGPDAADSARSMLATWLRKLRRVVRRWPVTALASKFLQSWWQVQPWRETGELLAGSMIMQGRPLVRRHPIAAMAVAAGVGGALMALRPWRWVLAEVKRLPLQTAWLTLLLQMLVDSQTTPPRATPADDASPAAGASE